eukprot:TRINITY_DN11144_c0_g1_i2.p1 TRINITY_DN11144_c0_g1~~TRINITY_DN11144_c0_g1_i2.p1  ORF type:complete len:888 (+),score=212.48 TRINITY_DN11144_c0_g1_i2:141-2804(+)
MSNCPNKKRKLIEEDSSLVFKKVKQNPEPILAPPIEDRNPYDTDFNFAKASTHREVDESEDNESSDQESEKEAGGPRAGNDSEGSGPAQTNWNAEFQTYFEMPTKTSWQRLERARKIYNLYLKFTQTAVAIGKTIIEEISLCEKDKTINRFSHTRGIAGGEKYCYSGIFFKLAIDHKSIYGGDHFSMKAAGHEIKAFNELLHCPSIGNIHFPAMIVIDFFGYRLVAEAALPISRSTLRYGSDDGCKTIHDDSEDLRGLIGEVAEYLCLKKHISGYGLSKVPQNLVFPADVEGHLGSDNRYYIVDMQRLFPTEQEFVKSYGVLIKADEKEPLELITIDRHRYTEEISNYLGSNWFERCFPDSLTVIYHAKKSGHHNRRASCLCKADVHGDAISVIGEVSASLREVLFYMLRPEWLRKNRIKVSSDTFTRFGEHNKEEHEQQIYYLRKLLIEQNIPQFVRWLTMNTHLAISSLHLSKLFHEQGINLRYVGFIYMLVPETNKRLKYHVLGFTMLARVIKDLLQAKLRSIPVSSLFTLKEAIVDFFNVVLGDGKESDLFWQICIPVHLMHKYGAFGFRYDPKKDDFQKLLGHSMLFRLLQESTGVFFYESTNIMFLPENAHKRGAKPLKVEDLEDISVKVKRWRLELLNFIEDVCRNVKRNEENPIIERDLLLHKQEDSHLLEKFLQTGISKGEATKMLSKIQSQRQHRHLSLEIFGEHSSESVASLFKYAHTLTEYEQFQSALPLIMEGLKCIIDIGDIPGEVLLSCLYITAFALEKKGDYLLAKYMYESVLHHLQELFDSVTEKESASPFEVEFHQRLIFIAQLLNNKEECEEHQLEMEKLLQVFKKPKEALISVAREGVDKFLDHINLSGIKLNYSQELATFMNSLQQ